MLQSYRGRGERALYSFYKKVYHTWLLFKFRTDMVQTLTGVNWQMVYLIGLVL